MGRRLHPPLGVSVTFGNTVWQDDVTGALSLGPQWPSEEAPLEDLKGSPFYERWHAKFVETAQANRLAEERDALTDRPPDPADLRTEAGT